MATVTPQAPEFDLVIEAGRREGLYWRDLLKYRELLLILVWRDIAVRYKQTVVGVAWVLVRPLATAAALTFVFGKLSKLPSEGVPYPLLVLVAMLPWQLFSTALTGSLNSLVGNAQLISKVYFPRLLIPLSSILSNLVDFALTLVLTLGVMLAYGHVPGWTVLGAPAVLLLALVCAAGAGLWLGALNVRYRDFGQVAPFLLQIGLYVSPVGFLTAVVPEEWRLVFALNPLVGIIDGFRWCLLGAAAEPYWPGVGLSATVSGLLLASGLWYFRRTERTFADVI